VTQWLRWAPFASGMLAALVAAGCGGDDALGTDEYRERLDGLCRELNADLLELPVTARNEDLSLEELQARADEISEEYQAEVEDLNPPEELEDAHADLLALSDEEPPSTGGPDAAFELAQRSLDIYESLGAEGCAEGQRQVVETVAEGLGDGP
jgi:hypothetical protein